jgi:hypothetical protein
MFDSMNSTEAICRHRQRSEICATLKRSSIIHHVYIAKNVVEIALLLAYLPLNMKYALQELDHVAECQINIQSFAGVIDTPGTVHFQCHGKKMSFYSLVLLVHTIFLAFHGLCSMVAICWCLFFRPVTNMLRTIG